MDNLATSDGCIIDFEIGPDGDLAAEFKLMQNIMENQQGQNSNQEYVCMVADWERSRVNSHFFECLDIGSVSTLTILLEQANVTTQRMQMPTHVGLEEVFMERSMLDFKDVGQNATTLFGMHSRCGGFVVGDGMINGYDAYVLMAAQFRRGPYSHIDRDFSKVFTVEARNGTEERCNAHHALDNITAWNLEINKEPCIEVGVDIQASVSNGRMMLEDPSADSYFTDEWWGRIDMGPHVHGAADIVMPKYASSMSHAESQLVDEANDGYSFFPNLDMRIFLYDKHADGDWYWVNVPTIHTALELHLIGMSTKNNDVFVSNKRVDIRTHDNTGRFRPSDPSEYEIRFFRHREIDNNVGTTMSCAIVRATVRPSDALKYSTLAISQVMHGTRTSLCAFDILIWKPKDNYASSYSSYSSQNDCPVGVEAGSTAMGGSGGRVLSRHICADTEPARPPSTPPGKHYMFGVATTIYIQTNSSYLSNDTIDNMRTSWADYFNVSYFRVSIEVEFANTRRTAVVVGGVVRRMRMLHTEDLSYNATVVFIVKHDTQKDRDSYNVDLNTTISGNGVHESLEYAIGTTYTEDVHIIKVVGSEDMLYSEDVPPSPHSPVPPPTVHIPTMPPPPSNSHPIALWIIYATFSICGVCVALVVLSVLYHSVVARVGGHDKVRDNVHDKVPLLNLQIKRRI